jgi:hypothetical protein
VAREVRWRKLVYLGQRRGTSAWRAHAAEGGEVLFILPLDQLKFVVLGLGLDEPLVGADPDRHKALVDLLRSVGLERLAGRYRPSPPSAGQLAGIMRPPADGDGEE